MFNLFYKKINNITKGCVMFTIYYKKFNKINFHAGMRSSIF